MGKLLPGKIALDPDKVQIFTALRLLHTKPADVRRKYAFPAPQRIKRARVTGAGGIATAGGATNPPLMLSEFLQAFREMSGSECTKEELEKLLGAQAHID